jgi:hypothetical protein
MHTIIIIYTTFLSHAISIIDLYAQAKFINIPKRLKYTGRIDPVGILYDRKSLLYYYNTTREPPASDTTTAEIFVTRIRRISEYLTIPHHLYKAQPI